MSDPLEAPAKKSWRDYVLRRDREPLRKEILNWGFPLTVIILLLLSDPIEHIWPFEYAGLRSTEIFLHGIRPKPAEYTRIVDVNSEYYAKQLENDCIPAGELMNIVKELLKYDPAVLVVDFDTSSKKYAGLLPPASNIPIVWARNARDVTDSKGQIELEPLPLLGTDTPVRTQKWGYALFPQNRDWTVREYQRTFEVGGVSKAPSLFWAAVEAYEAYCKERSHRGLMECPQGKENTGEKLTVPLGKSRYDVPKIPLDDLYQPGKQKDSTPRSSRTPLKGKIVLLGGTYADTHATAWGRVNGVELVASAIESELDPQEEQAWLAEAATILSKIGLALIIFYIHLSLRPVWALVATGFLLSGVVLLGALLVLWFTPYRAEFVPFLVGIWIEQTHEVAAHAQRDLKQLERSGTNHHG